MKDVKIFHQKSFEQIMTTLFCLRIFNQNKITILGKLANFVLRLILVFFIKSDYLLKPKPLNFGENFLLPLIFFQLCMFELLRFKIILFESIFQLVTKPTPTHTFKSKSKSFEVKSFSTFLYFF